MKTSNIEKAVEGFNRIRNTQDLQKIHYNFGPTATQKEFIETFVLESMYGHFSLLEDTKEHLAFLYKFDDDSYTQYVFTKVFSKDTNVLLAVTALDIATGNTVLEVLTFEKMITLLDDDEEWGIWIEKLNS